MYPRNFRPLVIVGRQRAGTRFLAQILNSFREVSIQGELPNPVMQSAVEFVRQLDSHYAEMAAGGDRKSRREYRGWLKKKEDLIFAIWEHAGQSRRVAYRRTTKYYGYKRPNNEFYFDFYEEAFTYRRPVYIYCTRNFIDNYLSIASRWPERNIELVSGDYLRSIAQYHKMIARASDRVLLFNLDDYIAGGLAYVERNILTPLCLPLTQDRRQELEQMPAVNRTEEDLKLPRRRRLTRGEQQFVRAHPELRFEFTKLCESEIRQPSST